MATNTDPLIPVNDIASLLNTLVKQHVGDGVVINADLSNLADFGKTFDQLPSSTKNIVTSGFVTLVTEQMVIVKQYRGNGIDIIRSRSDFESSGGIVQKVRPALPSAVSDPSYDPEPNSTNDPFVNYPVNFETEYFDKPNSWMYAWSKPERWMTGMFLSREKLIQAVNSIDVMIDNALALNIEDMTMGLIRASIALNLHTAADLTSAGTNMAVNLLPAFKAANPSSTLKASGVLRDPEFCRFAIHRIWVVMDYMKSYSRLFNEKKFPNFVSEDELNVVLLGQFRRAVDQFLLSDTYHDEFLQLPGGKTVAAWQGFLLAENTVPNFESTSTVKATIEVPWESGPVSIDTSGVLAHIFSNERVGLYNLSTKTTSQPDAVGLKTNYFTHGFARGIVDPYENGVTFYVKDPA